MADFDDWKKDPEFQALPDIEKRKIYQNYFFKEMVDDEFYQLPATGQFSVRQNYLKAQGLKPQKPPMDDVDLWHGPLSGLDLKTVKDVARGALRGTLAIGDIYPVLETAASWVTMAYGLPAAGYAGLAMLPAGQQRAAKTVQKVSDLLIYQPQTKHGQELTEASMWPLTQLEKAAGTSGEYTLKEGLYGTGIGKNNPYVATAVHAAIMGSPVLLSKGVRARLKSMPNAIADSVRNSDWYRQATIHERAMVVQTLAETLEKNPGMTEAEVLRQFNNPSWREEALAPRRVGETREPIVTEPPAGPRTALPAGQGFEMLGPTEARLRLRKALPGTTYEEPRALPPGQGFEMVPPDEAARRMRSFEDSLRDASQLETAEESASVMERAIQENTTPMAAKYLAERLADEAERAAVYEPYVHKDAMQSAIVMERAIRDNLTPRAREELANRLRSEEEAGKFINQLSRTERMVFDLMENELEQGEAPQHILVPDAGSLADRSLNFVSIDRSYRTKSTNPAWFQDWIKNGFLGIKSKAKMLEFFDKVRSGKQLTPRQQEVLKETIRQNTNDSLDSFLSPDERYIKDNYGWDGLEEYMADKDAGRIPDAFYFDEKGHRATEPLLDIPSKKPWQMTQEEISSQPGYKIEKLPGEDIARANTDGSISLDPDKFFGHGFNERKDIFLHEQAHFIEEKISPESKARYFDNPIIMNYRGRNINEKLANMIQDGKLAPEVLAEYPALAKAVPPEAEVPAPATSQQGMTGGRLAQVFEGKKELSPGKQAVTLHAAFTHAKKLGIVKTISDFKKIIEEDFRAGLIDKTGSTTTKDVRNSRVGTTFFVSIPNSNLMREVNIRGMIERDTPKVAPMVQAPANPQRPEPIFDRGVWQSDAPEPEMPKGFGSKMREKLGLPPEDEGFIKLFAGVHPEDILKVLKRTFGTGMVNKDINWLTQVAGLPDWIAKDHPESFGRIRDLQRSRDLNRNLIRNDFMQGLAPALVLRGESAKKVGDIFWKEDQGFKLKPEAITKLTPEEQAAYKAKHEIVNYLWTQDFPQLLRDLDFEPTDIQELIQTAGYKPGFMPHPRDGAFFARVVKDKKIIWREHFNDYLAETTGKRLGYKIGRVRNRLEANFPGDFLEIDKVQQVPDDMFFSVSPGIVQELINIALEKVPEAEARATLKSAINEAVSDVFKVGRGGFMAHTKERQNIPGFDKSNWKDALVSYVSSYASFKSKILASKELWKVWPNIDWSGKPQERAYAAKYIHDNFANATRMDHAIDRARSILFFQFIGANLKSAALNSTQNFIAAIPRLSVETNWAGPKIATEMVRAAGDVMRSRFTQAEEGMTKRATAQKGRLEPEVMGGLSRARQTGIVESRLTDELMGMHLGKYDSTMRHISNAARFFFSKVETIVNREATWVTACRIGLKEKGMTPTQAWDFADRIVEETHFNYGKANLPGFARGGTPQKIMRGGYAFRSYTLSLLNLYKNLAKDYSWRGKIGLAKGLGALLLLGGVGAIPLAKTMIGLYQKATGTNLKSEIKEQTGDWADFVLYGAPGLIGIDLTGSVDIEVPRDLKELVGAPASWVEKSISMAEDIKGGDTYRAIEDFPLMPSSIRNPMGAYRMATRGMEGRTGKPILNDDFEPITLTPSEAVLKSLGFQPTKASEAYRKYEARRETQDFWQGQAESLKRRYIRAFKDHGASSNDAQDARKDIYEFNQKRPSFIPPISISRLKQERLHPRPSKRERALQREVQ